MEIDMSLIEYRFENCFEAVLANMAHHVGRDYELMYINEWDFKVNFNDEIKHNYLGGALDSYRDKRGALCKYHGVCFIQHECPDFNSFLAVLKRELKLSKPVTVRMDTFYCPWDKSYQKHHNPIHIFFIKGVDESKKALYCTDAFYMIDHIEISFEDFLKGYSGQYGVFEINADISKEVNGMEILEEMTDRIIKNDIFSRMRLFTEKLSQTDSMASELYGYKEAWRTPLYYNFNHIEASRRRIPILFSYLINKYNVRHLEQAAEELKSLNEKWDGFNKLILKMLVSKNLLPIRDSVVQKLTDITLTEETIFNSILENLKLKGVKNYE